jgi:hypothetical protein
MKLQDLKMLRKEGVNRLSIGMQSANNEILKMIGRRHNFKQVEMAVRNARKAGFENISLDLIYGLPSQTKADWAETLERAVELRPEHLSCYGLQLEEDTPLYRNYHDSPLLPDADTQEMDSTAAAASYVAESGDKTIAAVAAPGAAKLYGLSVLAENVQITDANKTRFYVLASAMLQEDGGETHAVLAATCEANRIDDIIVEIHNTGAELVTIHDRPEGSMLGRYNYIIEVENKNGVTDKLLEKLGAIEDVRILGRFRVAEKQTESHTG